MPSPHTSPSRESKALISETGSHEVGHALGLGHNEEGLMTAASSDTKRSKTISDKDVKSIISNVFKRSDPDAGKGTMYESGKSPVSNGSLKRGQIREKTK